MKRCTQQPLAAYRISLLKIFSSEIESYSSDADVAFLVQNVTRNLKFVSFLKLLENSREIIVWNSLSNICYVKIVNTILTLRKVKRCGVVSIYIIFIIKMSKICFLVIS